MRLKSIEIKGFKSFADKTQIFFDQDITGIVGPNGCGKSNVVDAIRWVLGEQKSKTLRLEKMDNIIFNGTKDRHAANIAEVSMTLDNTRNLLPTEYSSVTITRTITRDGDSEYKLNGISCRLKDIRDLFMDTGISTDTYAIIELKMIDDILNDVEKARRRLIEQAAGISKYKARKRETQLKLQSTEADLSRVEDLLFEIEKNLKAMESQARKARQYKNLKEEYRQLTLDLIQYDLLEINQITEIKKQEISSRENNILAVNTAIHQLEAELASWQTQIVEREQSLSEEQKTLNQFINDIQEKENEKRLLQQQQQFNLNKINLLKKQLDAANETLENIAKEIAKADKDIHTANEAMLSLKEERDHLQQLLEKKRAINLELRSAWEKSDQQVVALRHHLFNAEKQLAIKQSELESHLKAAQQSLFENEERQQQLMAVQAEVKAMEEQVEKQRTLLAEIEQKEQENIEIIATLEQTLEQSRNTLTNVNRQLDARQNEYRLTKNMIDNLEGFPEAIKFLKKKAGWLKDSPLLSDILYCEEQYRAALETVLQPYLNHFIVQTENEALQAIHLLREGNIGKAGFLVMEYFEKTKRDAPQKFDGILPMEDILEIDPAFKPVTDYLLQGIYIATEQDPEHWKAPKGFKGILVSKTGHLMRSSHQMSGGSVGLFEGKRLGRLKNLEKMEADIKMLEKLVLDARKVLQDTQHQLQTRRNNSYKQVIERERRALQELEKQAVSRRTRIDNFREAMEKSEARHQAVQQSIKTLQASILPLEEEVKQHRELLQRLQEESIRLEKGYKSEAESLSTIQDKFNQQNIRYLQQENLIKSLQQAKSFKLSQQETLTIQSGNNDLEIKQLQQESKVNDEKIKALEHALTEAYSKRNQMQANLSEREKDFFELRNKVHQQEDAIREQEKLRRQAEDQIRQLKDELNDQKVRLGIIREKLSYEFNIELEEILDKIYTPETSLPELKDRQAKVRKRLDQFGEVNPMAEEAYNEIKMRYDFIQEQKQDLVNARESLLQTIEEVDNTAKTKFLETFAAVRENFISVFRNMFTKDDNCDLVLENPEDILESDIDIIAKPKGKRPQSINQLSGGEKTLTALSLLFGIYLYKPAPFCILDEVDAPLDDTNIKKFNDAIRSFSDKSQFILVTHNKSTMAEVDAIYGVTMVKQGISKVVPVDFRQLANA
jgi:chromosome segregation protein